MLDLVIDARAASIGNGFNVKRILPYRLRRMLGPFIFMDHAGPVRMPPNQLASMDVLPHPHIGLSTVSYLFDGQVTHRDSLGVQQVIRPGEVNWMTAGRGIAHSERFEDPAMLANGSLEMIQTWVALPETVEESAPTFDNYQPHELPIVTDTGVWLRLIAGEAFGLTNEVKTQSPLFYAHVVLQPGARFGLPQGHSERGAYVAKGSVEVNGHTHGVGQLLVFTNGIDPVITAIDTCTLMVLGGEPLGERFICRAAGAVEFCFLPAGTYRAGQSRLAGGPHFVASQRQLRVCSAAPGFIQTRRIVNRLPSTPSFILEK